MGIFNQLKRLKSPSVVKELNQFLKFSTRLREAGTVVEFIEDCVKSNAYPTLYWKHLRRNRIYPNSKTLRRHALNQCDTVRSKMEEFSLNISQRQITVDQLLSTERKEFLDYVQVICDNRARKKLESLTQSLSTLVPQSAFPTHPERYVFNFSNVHLSPILIQALSLGYKFCCPRRRDSQLEIELQFESLFGQTKDLVAKSIDDLQRFKSTLVSSCYQYRRYQVTHKGLINRQHLNALKELRNNPDLIISRPDKGAGIVVMNRSDYVAKLLALLQDESKFM
jgi:midasin (ATPase involved in ribosome maturation)